MGTAPSKPLCDFTADEVSTFVRKIGDKYSKYAKEARDNGVDGGFLQSLENKQEFLETLDDIDCTSRLHRRVLLQKWNAARAVNDEQLGDGVKLFSYCTDISNTSESSTDRDSHFNEIMETVASYQIHEDTPAEVLTDFDEIAAKALTHPNVVYAGVHLMHEKGHTALVSRLFSPTSGHSNKRLHRLANDSYCHNLILQGDRDYDELPVDITKAPDLPPDLIYRGHLVRSSSGVPVGTVCFLVKKDAKNPEDDEDRREIMREMSQMASEQLEKRKALVNRTNLLNEQVADMIALKQQEKDSGAADFVQSPVRLKRITQAQVDERTQSLTFPLPEQLAKSGKTRRSAELPAFREYIPSVDEDLPEHLPSTLYDTLDSMGLDRTPISNDDMERVAVVEELGLHRQIDPESAIAKSFQRLSKLALQLFQMAAVKIAFTDHQYHYDLVWDLPRDEAEKTGTVVKSTEEGEPFMCRTERGIVLCNYVLTSKKSFVIHDLYGDESFSYVKHITDTLRFYSGTPIMFKGHVCATLCLFDSKARPDFDAARILQQEQIAALIEQQIGNWYLDRELNKVENERKLLESPSIKSSPPENYVALVSTDLEGSTKLWETHPTAMNRALQIHDSILRECAAEAQGYEIATEGDAFLFAFHDSVDALEFALQAQQKLYDAPWSEEILSLPEACDDGRGFRGLRVRMAIHYGDGMVRNNELTNRREYIGPTLNITKSIEDMAHGGQILVSSDVWNAASFFVESKLRSAQVVDLGTHILMHGTCKSEGVIAKGVLQVVPQQLAFDYFADRTLAEGGQDDKPIETKKVNVKVTRGRQFLPPQTLKSLSASFFDAPHEGNSVTMLFVNPSVIEKHFTSDVATHLLAALTKLIGTLVSKKREGYQCDGFMLSFHNVPQAIEFGLDLQTHLQQNTVLDKRLDGMIKVGIHEGTFITMGPHKTTGRADYFGTVVNRAARVAKATSPGQVCLGVIGDNVPSNVPGLGFTFIEKKDLKGVQEKMSLYSCRKVESSPTAWFGVTTMMKQMMQLTRVLI